MGVIRLYWTFIEGMGDKQIASAEGHWRLMHYNIELLKMVEPYKNLKPLVFLACCKDTINDEVNFFEKNYVNKE